MQWANGPEPLDNSASCMHFKEIRKFIHEENHISSEEIFMNSGHQLYSLIVKYRLLYKEMKNKRPPKNLSVEIRGKLDIPFKTERYRKWVNL